MNDHSHDADTGAGPGSASGADTSGASPTCAAGTPMSGPEIALADKREYAWLLERTKTAIDDIAATWNWIPIRKNSIWSRLVGYPARFILVLASIVIVAALALAIIIVLVEIPVTGFVLLEPLVPDWIWWSIIGIGGACIVYYIILVIGVQLHVATHGDESADRLPSLLRDNVVASTVDEQAGWNPWQSVHVSHDSARGVLIGSNLVMLGILFQFAAVVLGPAWFDGPVGTFWQWPLMFGQGFFNTMLLGVPDSLLAPFSDIEPRGVRGSVLLVLVDVCYAGGWLALLIPPIATYFKPRELFNGTVRDLADHIENIDTVGKHLTIHRIAVVRPLDEAEVLTITRDEFYAQVKKSTPPRSKDGTDTETANEEVSANS